MNPHSIVCLNVKKLLAQRNSLHGQLAKWFEWPRGFKSCHLKKWSPFKQSGKFPRINKNNIQMQYNLCYDSDFHLSNNNSKIGSALWKLRLSTLSKFIFEKIFTQYSFFVLKFVIFLSLCCMKYIIFLYINANKKLVLLSATTVPVEKRSSWEIIQFKN